MKPFGFLSFVCAAALTVACAGDTRNDTATTVDDTSTVGTSGEASISGGDRDFVTEMLQDGTAEVQLGTMASERGSSAAVKQFGQQMVQDHTKAGEQLKQIASRYGIQPDTTALSDDHRDLMDRLSKLQGAEFDREYINAMVDGHEDVLDKLESRVDEDRNIGTTGQSGTSARTGTSESEPSTSIRPESSDNQIEASLNSWAADTLPVVQKHLEQAKSIDQTLESGNRGASSRR